MHREEGYVRGEPEVFLELDTAGNVLVSANSRRGTRDCANTIKTTRKKGLFWGARKMVCGGMCTATVNGNSKEHSHLVNPRANTAHGTPTASSRKKGSTRAGPNTRNGDCMMTKVPYCTSTFTGTASFAKWMAPKWTNGATAS